MNKRSKSILGLALACLVFAAIAYTLPETQTGVPQKMVLRSSAGRVVFTHAKHSKIDGLSCESCHHELKIPERELSDAQKLDPANVLSCTSCHIPKDTSNFVAEHIDLYASKNLGGSNCLVCHHTDSLEENSDGSALSIEQVKKLELSSCSSCHTPFYNSFDAFHKSCMGCHDSMKQGPGKEAACQQCHLP